MRELDVMLRKDYEKTSLRAGQMTYWGLGGAQSIPNEPFVEIARSAASKFVNETQLYLYSQASIGRMASDILNMLRVNLDGGDEAVVGTITSGGTESISLAIKAARDYERSRRDVPGRPNIVVPFTAHMAFDKAAQYFDMDVVRVETNEDWTANIDAMAKAITSSTVMIAGSAPSYTHGVIDAIEALGALAQERDLWLHVDACVGGIILPFMRKAGQSTPAFDFSVPGVTSLSTDLHKHGYTPIGISTLWIRGEERREFHMFKFDNWPKGFHKSPTFISTRSAAPLAGAWATMLSLGESGYLDLASRMMSIRDRLVQGIASVDHLYVCGNPQASIVNYASKDIDMFAVADRMTQRGWYISTTAQPAGGHHLVIEPARDVSLFDDYLDDVRASVADVVSAGSAREQSADRISTYG
ncbi:aspartate aminotransferase family protein [Escherichia coli]|nr:aspartate aminotransferase family protein [Escherichia coli]